MVCKCLKNDLSSLTIFVTVFPYSFSQFIQHSANGGHCDSCNYDVLQRLYLEEKNISLW